MNKGNNFCLNLHCNRINSYLFVNGVKIYQFEAKLMLNAYPLYLRNISEDFAVANMKKTGLHGYVYDFSVNYDSIGADDIFLDIHKDLIKKHNMKECLDLLKIFIWLSIICTARSFGGMLASNSKEPRKCVSLNNQPCKVGSALLTIH